MAVKEAEDNDALDDVDPEKENAKPEKPPKMQDHKHPKLKVHSFKKQKVW